MGPLPRVPARRAILTTETLAVTTQDVKRLKMDATVPILREPIPHQNVLIIQTDLTTILPHLRLADPFELLAIEEVQEVEQEEGDELTTDNSIYESPNNLYPIRV